MREQLGGTVLGVETKLEYDVLGSDTPADLVKQVRKAIKEGWRPLGGLTFGNSGGVGGRPYWYQAVIRRE